MELLRVAAIGSWVVGLGITAVSIVVMIRGIHSAPARLRALGFTYLGMFVFVVGTAILLLALIGEERLPSAAGIVAIAIVGITALRLRQAATRAFSQAGPLGPGGIGRR